MRQLSRRSRLVALIATVALTATACGTAGDNGGPVTQPTTGGTNEPAPTTEPDEPLEELRLTMGGSQSTSSVFAFLTAHGRLAGNADGAITINVRETGASSENIALVADGAVDFGITGLSTIIQAQRGIGAFEGQARPDICNMMNYLVNAEFLTVRADAGIETVYDLDGRNFAPSFQGSALYDNVQDYFEALGIAINVFDGSLEDIANAMKDGRIDGFGKSGNGFGPDAAMLDVASAVPVKAIGLTQDDIDTIFAADPAYEALFQFAEVAPGSIYDNDESFMTSVVIAAYFTETDAMSEEAQYRLTKALWESIDQAAEETNYAGGMGRVPSETINTAETLQLCPGAVRYYQEIGEM